MRQCALEAMKPYFSRKYGNASTPYSLGREARGALDEARERVATALGVIPREIIFTGGGTESINHSIIGAVLGNSHRGAHLITTTFEHHATHTIFKFPQNKLGATVDKVSVGRDGMVNLEELESKLRDDTILVSVMHVNNELGTIQDLDAVVEMCKPRGILVQTDCVQAIGKIPVNLREMDVDLACASSHKFGGPKGVGFLYIKLGIHIQTICESSHEFGIRGGTENVPGIVGMSAALVEAIEELPEFEKRARRFKKQIWDCIKSAAPDAEFNGDPDRCVPSMMNVRLPGCESEMLVLALDRFGVAASVGSACQTDNPEPSHVLTAMGLTPQEAFNSLRLSMGYTTTQEDIDKFISVFPKGYNQVKSVAVT